MDTSITGIAVLPDARTAAAVFALGAGCGRRALVRGDPEGVHPYCTLYRARFAAKVMPQVVDAFKELHRLLEAFTVTLAEAEEKHGFLQWSVAEPHWRDFRYFQATAMVPVARFRSQESGDRSHSGRPLEPDEARCLELYGFPYVAWCYRPRIVIGKAGGAIPPESLRGAAGRECRFERLALLECDEDGLGARIVRQVALKG